VSLDKLDHRAKLDDRRRIDGLDLLRGMAVGLVLLRHALPAVFGGAGVVGIVMFFALSGFLITGLLLNELGRTGRVDLRRFYLRRALRLFPALLFLLAGFVVVTLTLDPLGDRDQLLRTVLIALTYTGDLPFGHASDATFHLWTLATEEQFYLVWPAVLGLAFARRRVGVALVLVAAACLAGCVLTLLWLKEAPDLTYSLPTSWAVCFVIGSAAKVYAGRLAVPRRLVLVCLAALAVQSVIPLRGHALTYLAGGPVIAVLTALLLLAWRGWADVRQTTLRPLVLLGTVSYAAYLWNYPLTLWLRPHLGVEAGVVAAALTLVAAAASWRLVEQPAQRWRSKQVASE
jgi:peptidoglycan/LPS O-acetylase OafA/YrhL